MSIEMKRGMAENKSLWKRLFQTTKTYCEMLKRKAFIGIALFTFVSLLCLYLHTLKIYDAKRFLSIGVTHDHVTPSSSPPVYRTAAPAIGAAKNTSSDGGGENSTVKEITTHPTPTSTTCVKGYLQKQISQLIPEFSPDAHLFLEPGYKEWKDLRKGKYPYGYEDTEILDQVLKLMPAAGRPDRFGDRNEVCRRCILIGNSGVSLGKRLGQVINGYDVVIRMNDAPVVKYEADLGTKTTFRMIYPESSTYKVSGYENDTDILFLIYKSQDILWLEAVLKKDPTKLKLKFWKSVSKRLVIPSNHIRIVNPGLHDESLHLHLEAKRRPSCGLVALVMALHYCDHVDITGYGYDIKFPVHYYKPGVSGVPQGSVHSWNDEKLYILKLLYCGVIGQDLSGHYAKEAKRWGFSPANCTKA